MTKTMEEIVAHLKSTGFVFQGSEIYGGLANSWDYGPLGVEVKNKIKNSWWKYFIKKNPLNIGLDSSIILNSKVWKASGHIDGFNDPLIDCKKCHSRFRADKLIEDFDPKINLEKLSNDDLEEIIKKKKIKCPSCGAHDFTSLRQFTLMFKTNQGVVEDENSTVYLRPETAQGIFINFKNAQRSLRKKLPFGIGQIGKSFRNEITPGNFIFRTREFEQMELEFFYQTNDQENWFEYWLEQVKKYLNDVIHLDPKNYRIHDIPKDDLAHYSKRTIDLEFKFPFGWGELWGIAHRGNFDLTAHQNASGQDLSYLDPEHNQKVLAEVIEPSVGVERLMLALFCQAFTEEKIDKDSTRVVLKLPYNLAPYQIAVMPLQKQQIKQAKKVFAELLEDFDVTFDETGNVGKRYRRQDAIGTPFVITYDFDSDKDHQVTIRNRDTMKQKRVLITDLKEYFKNQF